MQFFQQLYFESREKHGNKAPTPKVPGQVISPNGGGNAEDDRED
jgi:hypothetical protein